MQIAIETTVDDGTPVTETLSFSYDASGLPMSVVYNGTAYFYTVNLQGDVMAIVDTTGNPVVTYAYDAWGNILSVTGTMAETLGQSNPLRYRGYVYDNETQLYYLQSRYYDPNLGRFINADALVSTGQGILGNNMFAYCLNNPVCRKDIGGAVSQCIYDSEFDPTDDDNDLGHGYKGDNGLGKSGHGNSGNNGQGKNGHGNTGDSGLGKSGQSNSGQSNSGTNSAGRTEVHHVVEQCQANKSGFSQSQIQADSNKIELSYDTHRAISGYYSSKQYFTNGMRVRDWLAGQSFEFQTQFGWNVIEMWVAR